MIFSIKAFSDNYIWALFNDKNEIVLVDPGDEKPVLQLMKNEPHFKLAGILITHKHWDHCNGVSALLKKYHAPVYGPKCKELDFVTHPVKENDHVMIEGFPQLTIMEIPGHTLEHIAYYNEKILFCGDTLFTGGCGRIFEGTPTQMFHTLQKILALPSDILIYCGHEYTLKNLRFAQNVEPHNPDLLSRFKECEKLRSEDKPTVPSTLQLEKLTNPFLRCHIQTVVESVEKHYNKKFDDVIEVFAHLRQWKDGF